MDLFSVLGLVIAFVGVIGGQILEGGHPDQLLQVTAFLIVIIGSLGATMVATHPSDLPFAIQALKRVFMPAKYDFHGLMEKLLEFLFFSQSWARRYLQLPWKLKILPSKVL